MHQKPEQILFDKLTTFCNYRERCTSEIEKKFYDLKAEEPEKSIVMQWLKEGDYFSDELYCHSFVSGKFRIKKWGKMKINAALKAKRLPEHLIKKALEEIDQIDYRKKAEELIERKVGNNKLDFNEKQKVIRALYIKGYPSSLTLEILTEIEKASEDSKF